MKLPTTKGFQLQNEIKSESGLLISQLGLDGQSQLLLGLESSNSWKVVHFYDLEF